jgi:hypothetical protein
MEPKTVQEVVMSSLQAEESGVVVDWKTTCLHILRALESNQTVAEVIPEIEE